MLKYKNIFLHVHVGNLVWGNFLVFEKMNWLLNIIVLCSKDGIQDGG